jgi:hypothetical protein
MLVQLDMLWVADLFGLGLHRTDLSQNFSLQKQMRERSPGRE